ncbi:hypothetical protein [Natronomonas sp. LN261]|uniref:DUF7261 family protein n=1 Tax=Natronomonas sp. LN261 TaxID=2750669 RepID=UPI0015EF1171|nr:hypothetical protein [Natronomonas sp. LN261]
MAQVSDRLAQVSDRGQMILVTGIVLAVMFVTLGVLLNAAIYADNVATRGGDPTGEALEYQNGVVDSVTGLLVAENANEDHSTASDIETAVESGIGEIDDAHAEMHLRRGAATTTEHAGGSTRGLRLEETASGEFADWTVDDGDNVRAFEIVFEPGSMPELNLTEDEPFEIDLGGERRYVYIDENASSDLVVAESVGSPDCTADAGDGPIRFNVTGERFGGDSCAIDWPNVTVTEVSFTNGANAYGTYDLVVQSGTDPGDSSLSGTDASVVIYSLDGIRIRMDTPKLSYERTVRIAPGEPDE